MSITRSRRLPAAAALCSILAMGRAPHADAANLCQGLITDKLPHPMTALAKPALGQAVTDPQFGTRIRRITAVPNGAGDDAIKPMYSTVSVWNADESRMLLYRVGSGHQLYDGTTYAFIRNVPISPNDEVNVFWHTTNPDILYYNEGNALRRYNVSTNSSTVVRTFTTPCGSNEVTTGDDPMFMSWDSNRIGLTCGNIIFTYEISSNTILGQLTSSELPPQFAPSGTLAYRARNSGAADVVGPNIAFIRSLDVVNSFDHASLGRKANGNDTYNAIAFDEGPSGSGVGSLVSHNMTSGAATVIVGPDTGYPYPPGDTHVSALVINDPGWVVVSISSNPQGQGILHNELLLANVDTGVVCRVAHVRTFGKANTHLGTPYWAEAHAVPSPRGTRIAFGSDWENGTSVDTYVVELPSFAASPDVAVSMTDSPDPVVSGGNVTYTITVTNNGPGDAANVTLTDTLPAGMTFVSVLPAACTGGQTVNCSFGTMAAATNVVVTLVATAGAPGSYSNTATVNTTSLDGNPANNTASSGGGRRP
jgi:uncharacterized repeat protein (TIGR01451 family)